MPEINFDLCLENFLLKNCKFAFQKPNVDRSVKQFSKTAPASVGFRGKTGRVTTWLFAKITFLDLKVFYFFRNVRNPDFVTVVHVPEKINNN